MLISNFRNAQQDDRWHGAAPTYFRLFLVKNILIVVLACLFVPESIIFRKSWIEEGYSLEDTASPYAILLQSIYTAPHFSLAMADNSNCSNDPWIRVSMALVPDAIFTFATAILCMTRCFHPITALVGAIILSGMYGSAASLNCLSVVANEVSFGARELWSRLCFAEVGVQVTITLLHIAMGVYASIAIHRWRKAKQGALRGNEEFGLEGTKGSGEEERGSFS
jgi:hypothetical protein